MQLWISYLSIAMYLDNQLQLKLFYYHTLQVIAIMLYSSSSSCCIPPQLCHHNINIATIQMHAASYQLATWIFTYILAVLANTIEFQIHIQLFCSSLIYLSAKKLTDSLCKFNNDLYLQSYLLSYVSYVYIALCNLCHVYPPPSAEIFLLINISLSAHGCIYMHILHLLHCTLLRNLVSKYIVSYINKHQVKCMLKVAAQYCQAKLIC